MVPLMVRYIYRIYEVSMYLYCSSYVVSPIILAFAFLGKAYIVILCM